MKASVFSLKWEGTALAVPPRSSHYSFLQNDSAPRIILQKSGSFAFGMGESYASQWLPALPEQAQASAVWYSTRWN